MSDTDGRLVVDLGGIDASVRERQAAWNELTERLDALRREVAMTGAEAHRRRARAARRPSQREESASADVAAAADAHLVESVRRFEAALREAEERRVALHGDLADLRRRRQDLLLRLPAAVSRTYEALTAAGRLPAVVLLAEGICGGCRSAQPDAVAQDLCRGAVAVCGRCGRLLVPARNGE